MRANFTRHSDAAVTIDYMAAWGVAQSRTFEQRGSYVWELYPEGRAHQVCKRLACNGSTLRVKESESLIEVLRREYRARQAADKRALWSI